MPAPTRPWLLVLALLCGLVQTARANWQYTTGQTGTYGGFSYQANVTENTGSYTGTAVFTSYSGTGTAEAIPSSVSIGITVNSGAANQEYRWVTCTVSGFQSFTLNSNATWTGDVNIIGDFNLNAHNLTVGTAATHRNVVHEAGSLTLGGGCLEISGDYFQQQNANNDRPYDTYCAGRLVMNNVADYMMVGGNTQFWTFGYAFNFNELTGGTLEIKGSFQEKVDQTSTYGNYPSSFPSSATHRVLLSGTATQTISFENPEKSYFNILEVTNPLADTSTVSIASGGCMKLDYTDTIGALYLGGSKQADGIYDASNRGGLVTGLGKIQVGVIVLYTPTITTPTSAGVTATAATLGGNVTADGGATVT